VTRESILSNGQAVVKFVLEGCAACEAFSPTFNEVKELYPNVPVYEVIASEEPELTREFGIANFPSTLLIKEGRVKMGQVGAISKPELEVFFTADPAGILKKHQADLKHLYAQSSELDKTIEEQKDLIFKLMQEVGSV
jgi:thiol-disulfide isomerase/thioredoxin